MQNLDNILSLESLDFFARSVVEGFLTGKHKSPYHGFSVEFAEHRLYNKGESTRHVDWKLYARTNKLFVKKYEEETNLRCHIVIDASSSMFYPSVNNLSIDNPNKILYAIYSSACLMEMFKKQRDSVGLSIFSEDLDFHSENKTTNKHHLLLKDQMLRLINSSSSSFKKTFSVDSIHKIAGQIHKRSLVIIFTDMLSSEDSLDDIFLSLQHLKFNKHEVVLFHLTENKTEYNLEFNDAPYKFIDIETNERVELNPMSIRDSYLTRSQEFLNELKLRCLKHKIDLVQVDINKSIENILVSYLLKRKKMF